MEENVSVQAATTLEELARQGFSSRVHKSSGKVGNDIGSELREHYDGLPIDPYATSSGRYRRYSRMVHLPWTGQTDWIPEVDRDGTAMSPYDQGKFNTEFQSVRYLPAITPELKANHALNRLLRTDVQIIARRPGFAVWPVYIGVHLIRLAVQPGETEAITTPNCMHQDGGKDMHTFVHLVQLENASGGVTMVGDPECAGLMPDQVAASKVRATLRLEHADDYYVVDDQEVSHHASGIRAIDTTKPAYRDIILVGVSPYQPTFFA